MRELERGAGGLFAEEHHALDGRVADLVTAQLVRLIRADRRRFVIVMGRSAGTRYAAFPGKLVELVTAHLRESVAPEHRRDDFMLRVFAGNFVAALLKIAERAEQDDGSVEDDVKALMRYHLGGIARFE